MVMLEVSVASGFAAWLKKAIDARGYNQSETSRKSGVSVGMLSMLLSGNRDPSRDTILRLADALAVDGESDKDRDARRNSALLARGFMPDPPTGGLPEIERKPVDRVAHLYTGLSPEGQKEADSFMEWLWDRERRRREGDAVEEIEDEGDD